MKMTMTTRTKSVRKGESAKDFARRVIETRFGQRVDDDTLDEVAKKILEAIDLDPKEKQIA